MARFYWPEMAGDIKSHISRCQSCFKRKVPSSKAPIVPISTSEPLELLAIDFLTFDKEKGYENILVETDSFKKYSWAFPTRNQKANTVAAVLWENVIANYGFPHRLHSGQAQGFDSKVISDLYRWQRLVRRERCRVTHRGMDRVGDLTDPPRYVRNIKSRKATL